MNNIITIIFLGLIICFSQNVSAQKKKDMELSYKKKLENFEIRMYSITDPVKKRTEWKIYKYINKRKNVLLDQYEENDFFDGELYLHKGDVRENVIIGDANCYNDKIYVLCLEHRMVHLTEYTIRDDGKVEKQQFHGGEEARGSYANFGGPAFWASMKKVNDALFLIESNSGVLMYFNLLSSKLTSLKFANETPPIKDPQNLFLNLDLDKNKEAVGQHIKEMLLENKQLNKDNEFKYLGYMDDSSSFSSVKNCNDRGTGWIFFFYQDALSLSDSIKIIRYRNHKKRWLIDDYREEAIKAPINTRFFDEK